MVEKGLKFPAVDPFRNRELEDENDFKGQLSIINFELGMWQVCLCFAGVN